MLFDIPHNNQDARPKHLNRVSFFEDYMPGDEDNHPMSSDGNSSIDRKS